MLTRRERTSFLAAGVARHITSRWIQTRNCTFAKRAGRSGCQGSLRLVAVDSVSRREVTSLVVLAASPRAAAIQRTCVPPAIRYQAILSAQLAGQLFWEVDVCVARNRFPRQGLSLQGQTVSDTAAHATMIFSWMLRKTHYDLFVIFARHILETCKQ